MLAPASLWIICMSLTFELHGICIACILLELI